MRYRDAVHVDLGSFYARNATHGKAFRLLGYIGIGYAMCHVGDADTLAKLLIALVVAWLVAWYRVVGALWRSSLVAAIVATAVLISLPKLATCLSSSCGAQP